MLANQSNIITHMSPQLISSTKIDTHRKRNQKLFQIGLACWNSDYFVCLFRIFVQFVCIWDRHFATTRVISDQLLRTRDRTADFKTRQNSRFSKRDKTADFQNVTKWVLLQPICMELDLFEEVHICCMAQSLRSLRQVATLRHGRMARRFASLLHLGH